MRSRRYFVVVPLIAAFCLVSLGSLPATAQSSAEILARGENVTVLRDGNCHCSREMDLQRYMYHSLTTLGGLGLVQPYRLGTY